MEHTLESVKLSTEELEEAVKEYLAAHGFQDKKIKRVMFLLEWNSNDPHPNGVFVEFK